MEHSLLPATRLVELMNYIVEGGRVCPQPQAWNGLWKKVGERVGQEQVKRFKPLILAAWHVTSDDEKRERFRGLVEFAAAHGMFDEVDGFLRRLEAEEWYVGT